MHIFHTSGGQHPEIFKLSASMTLRDFHVITVFSGKTTEIAIVAVTNTIIN